MLNSAIGRLRLVGMCEAVSFLVLLGVAMPLKYWADMPLAVKLVGWAHGGLFITFVALVVPAISQAGWSLWRGALLIGAALVPFGPFLADRSLKAAEARAAAATNASRSR